MNEKTWTWSTTGYGLAGKTHEEIYAICLRAGLAGIEGVPPLFEGLSVKEVESVGAGYRDAGLRIETFHLPFQPEDDIASFYETTRGEAVKTMRRWMEVAAALGAKVCIQHPSTTRCSADVEGLDAFIRAMDKSLKELLPAAENLGLTVAIENMLPGAEGGRIGSRPEHFERFIREFDHAALGFCLDTGHALVAGRDRADAFLDVMAPRVAAFHLADNAGDRDSHLAPGHGRVDWDRVFRGMAELEFEGQACIETPPFAFGPDYQPEAWAEMVADTEQLARQALASQSQQ